MTIWCGRIDNKACHSLGGPGDEVTPKDCEICALLSIAQAISALAGNASEVKK